MEGPLCLYLGLKVKPGPIERFKIENFSLDSTVDLLKAEAEKKVNIPSASLEIIHHGKVLKDDATLGSSGVKNGEMVHVVKKKTVPEAAPPPTYTDAELQQLTASLRTLGCTPNAQGWTRAMALLNDESAMAEILEHAPSLSEDCVTLSILHEVELLAALGANLDTMRAGANARPELPNALRHLMRLVRARGNSVVASENAPVSGFAYSLEALSEDEDGDDEAEDSQRNTITQEQLAAALRVATEAVNIGGRGGSQDSLLRALQRDNRPSPSSSGNPSGVITPEMFSEAITDAINRAASGAPASELSAAASSSQSAAANHHELYASQLKHMHEMGLLNDNVNIRALLICSGDVNAAINLVFSGDLGDN